MKKILLLILVFGITCSYIDKRDISLQDLMNNTYIDTVFDKMKEVGGCINDKLTADALLEEINNFKDENIVLYKDSLSEYFNKIILKLGLNEIKL